MGRGGEGGGYNGLKLILWKLELLYYILGIKKKNYYWDNYYYDLYY